MAGEVQENCGRATNETEPARIVAPSGGQRQYTRLRFFPPAQLAARTHSGRPPARHSEARRGAEMARTAQPARSARAVGPSDRGAGLRWQWIGWDDRWDTWRIPLSHAGRGARPALGGTREARRRSTQTHRTRRMGGWGRYNAHTQQPHAGWHTACSAHCVLVTVQGCMLFACHNRTARHGRMGAAREHSALP